MTKEELIRVKIIPQLNTFVDVLWDDGNTRLERALKLNSIIEELTNILNGTDDD